MKSGLKIWLLILGFTFLSVFVFGNTKQIGNSLGETHKEALEKSNRAKIDFNYTMKGEK